MIFLIRCRLKNSPKSILGALTQLRHGLCTKVNSIFVALCGKTDTQESWKDQADVEMSEFLL